MIVDASAWPQLERDAAVDWVFDHPHAFTTEDIEWSAEHFGMTEADCRQIFKDASVLGVMLHEDRPLYIFAVIDRKLSTASESRLSGLKWTMTKELVRFGKSDLGRKMLTGVIAFAEVSDVDRGMVRHQWARAIGFVPYTTAEFHGQVFHLYSYQGG